MKKTALFLSCMALLSCNKKKEKPEVKVTVTETIPYESMDKQIACNGNTYNYNIPVFNSSAEIAGIIENPIKELITKDFIDVTYNRDASLRSIIEIFHDRRERVLCNDQKIEGLLSVNTQFITENEDFVSYELNYKRGQKQGRLLKTFLKPELKEIHLSDLIPEKKSQDVMTIFNANLQQEVANLVTDIPTGDVQNQFMEYVRNTAFKFEPKDFETAGLAFDFKGEVTKSLRLSKKIDLPKQFEFLNDTVIIEIDAYQLTHYLDLSRLIN